MTARQRSSAAWSRASRCASGILVPVVFLLFAATALEAAADVHVYVKCDSSSQLHDLLPYERISWNWAAGKTPEKAPVFSHAPRDEDVRVLRLRTPIPRTVAAECAGRVELFDVEVLGKELRIQPKKDQRLGYGLDVGERFLVVYNLTSVWNEIFSVVTLDPSKATEIRHLARRLKVNLDPRHDEFLDRAVRGEQLRAEGQEALRAEAYQEAAVAFRQLIEIRPNDFNARLDLAKVEYHKKNYGNAERQFRELREANPERAILDLYLGHIDFERSRYLDAAGHYDNAVGKDLPAAWYYLAKTYESLGRLDKARQGYEAYLAVGSSTPLKEKSRDRIARIERSRSEASPSPSRRAAQGKLTRTPRDVPSRARGPAADVHDAAPSPSGAQRDARDSMGPVESLSAPVLAAMPGRPVAAGAYRVALEGFRRPQERLSNLKGRPMVLHFWASWCLPCRKEFPSLLEFFEKDYPSLAHQGLELVTVSIDYQKVDLQSYVDRDFPSTPEDLRIYWDPDWQLLQELDLHDVGLPVTVLVDRQGGVRTIHKGAQDWRNGGFLNQLKDLAVN